MLLSEPPPLAGPAGAEAVEAPRGPVALPFRPPPPTGAAFRIVLETSGESETLHASERSDPRGQHETHHLELEYRELPAEAGAHPDATLLRLDGLHYRLRQSRPRAEREIELGSDRLRVHRDGKPEMDLRGAQPREGLTPRMLLDETFAVVVHDGRGDPLTVHAQGVPRAREFLAALPVREAIVFTRLPFPPGEVQPGSRWRAVRHPPNPAGRLGLHHDVVYTLAGFTRVQGVDCAWILLEAELDAEEVPSDLGFTFSRAVASLRGEAWVELATSRVRRMVVNDEVRAAYLRGEGVHRTEHRLRYKDRLVLELRDPAVTPAKWTDGSERFGVR